MNEQMKAWREAKAAWNRELRNRRGKRNRDRYAKAQLGIRLRPWEEPDGKRD